MQHGQHLGLGARDGRTPFGPATARTNRRPYTSVGGQRYGDRPTGHSMRVLNGGIELHGNDGERGFGPDGRPILTGSPSPAPHRLTTGVPVRNKRRRFRLRRRDWVPHARRQHPTTPRERRRSPTRPRSSSDGSNGEQTRKRDAGPSKIVDAKPRRRRSKKQPARRCRPRRPRVNAANAISCV